MAKNKMKSHRGACKRMKLTGSGKVKRNKAYKSHILTKKAAKRKRPEKSYYFNQRRSEENAQIHGKIIASLGGKKYGKSKKRRKRP